jgi:4-diphosphocytidyl-2-C-methyl-D-erythritol kinase
MSGHEWTPIKNTKIKLAAGCVDGGSWAEPTAMIVLHSPAKLNLFLAITGRRDDGFHNLVSVVTPVEFGDTLTVEPGESEFTLACDEPALDTGDTNLIIQAAWAFRRETGWTGGARFLLNKRIPMGAGLGGGSSNATMALIGLNRLAGEPLSREALGVLAAQLGSDCALFLQAGPVVMRGRGETVQPLPPQAADRISGRRVLIFKPAFGINTAWAYRRLATASPSLYLAAPEAEIKLADWIEHASAPAEELLFNNMEPPAFEKYLLLPVVLERLREVYGLAPRMSGSGSACYALLPEGAPVDAIQCTIVDLMGRDVFLAETRLA